MLQPMVRAGDTRAAGLLGILMLYGKGISTDSLEGMRLIRVSAEDGNPSAQGVLAYAHLTGEGAAKDRTAARHLAELSAGKSDEVGQYVLARIKLSESSAESRATGADLLQKSAAQGLPIAQYDLGKFLLLGWVVAKDLKAGSELLAQGARHAQHLRLRAELIKSLAPMFDAFVQKKAVLECSGIMCGGRWGANRTDARYFYNNELWPELAAVVLKAGIPLDQTYFYLGRAAEGMGFLEAASSYYALVPGATSCRLFLNNCDGIEPSVESRVRLTLVEQQHQAERAEETARLARAAQDTEALRRRAEEQSLQ